MDRFADLTGEEKGCRFLSGGYRLGQFTDRAVGVVGQVTMVMKRDNQDGIEENGYAQL